MKPEERDLQTLDDIGKRLKEGNAVREIANL